MTMVNLVEIDTIYGFKAVELHNADLTEMDLNVDLLIVSAFKGSYIPTRGSLIGSLLENRGISVLDLSFNPSIDLRQSMSVWMSKTLENQPYQRLACVEMLDFLDTSYSVEASIKNLFSLINIGEMQDFHIHSVAMPLIGTGQQGIFTEDILKTLMPYCLKALNTIPRLQKIVFVERSKEKVRVLDRAMNDYLARKESDTQYLPDNHLSNAVREDLLSSLKKLKSSLMVDTSEVHTVNELLSKLNDFSLRFFELGILSRRLCELLVKDILERENLKSPLYNSIDALRDKKISVWIISYLHTLRIFGNEAAHEKDNEGYFPAAVHQQDLITILFCLNRVIDFWIKYRFNRSHNISESNRK